MLPIIQTLSLYRVKLGQVRQLHLNHPVLPEMLTSRLHCTKCCRIAKETKTCKFFWAKCCNISVQGLSRGAHKLPCRRHLCTLYVSPFQDQPADGCGLQVRPDALRGRLRPRRRPRRGGPKVWRVAPRLRQQQQLGREQEQQRISRTK